MSKIVFRVFVIACTILACTVAFLYPAPKIKTEQPPKVMNQPSGYQADKSVTATKQHPISSERHGWGFVRNKQHQRPGISREQEQLIKDYPVIFTMPTQAKEVALTFDLGYEQGYTPLILDTLKAHKVPATFFVTGYWLQKNVDLSKRIVAEGHLLGNHTMNHPNLAQVDQAKFTSELRKVEELIVQNCGVLPTVKVLRPPMGEYSERSVKWARDMGYTTVFWSIALLDWKPLAGPEVVVKSVMANLHPGAVILLHGVSKESTEGLDQLLKEMSTEGYKVVPLKQVRL
ncbi:MAG TPA: polysaccharide deacetylase family protein [Bacillota bacterium]|nr:polysaccharide deacetylase family protein [Bacillota bacterium]